MRNAEEDEKKLLETNEIVPMGPGFRTNTKELSPSKQKMSMVLKNFMDNDKDNEIISILDVLKNNPYNLTKASKDSFEQSQWGKITK